MTIENDTLVITKETLAWRAQAACVGHAEYFFNDAKKTNVREAKKICAACPVQSQCLEYGLTHVEYGVWGGLTANERRTLNRKRRLEAAGGLTKKVAE